MNTRHARKERLSFMDTFELMQAIKVTIVLLVKV